MHPHWQIIFLVNKKEKKNTHKHIHIYTYKETTYAKDSFRSQ